MQVRYAVVDQKLVQTDDENAFITLFVSPDEQEKSYLTGTVGIDAHTLNSALDPDELPRVEFEPEHVAVILKYPKSYSAADQFVLKVLSAGAFLFRDRLVIVSAESFMLTEGMRVNRAQSAASFLLWLAYRSIVHFREHLRGINMMSDRLQDEINTAMENKQLINMFTIEKSMVYYLYAIQGNGAVLERLKHSAGKMNLTADQVEFLDDIIVENTQCFRQAEIYSNILTSLMDARASIVSNNLNVLMKTLNIITIGLMVPMFVVSAFSMNVRIPFEEHPYAYWIIMGISLFSVAGFLLFWRFKKW